MLDNIKNTRCLIDFDGTVANSLTWCNVALDEMLMGKVTDKHYIEYYKDFGDSFEIIPGCPWKRILSLLCAYLADERLIAVRDDSDPMLPKMLCYDLGPISTMLSVAYDADFLECTSDNIAYYKSAEGLLIGVSLMEIATMEDFTAVERQSHLLGCADWKLLPATGLFAKTDPSFDTASEHFLYIADVEDLLESIFEGKVVRIMSERTFDELAIAPVVEFCREYKEAGGSLVIQSGSNPAIISKILEVLGIESLFDGMFCSPMLGLGTERSASPWEYKSTVIAAARDCADDGRKCFVLGDTKGDAFGACENALPFILVWRGYPSDPAKLTSAEGTLAISEWIDCSEEVLEGMDEKAMAREVATLMSFAESVGQGNVHVPIREH